MQSMQSVQSMVLYLLNLQQATRSLYTKHAKHTTGLNCWQQIKSGCDLAVIVFCSWRLDKSNPLSTADAHAQAGASALSGVKDCNFATSQQHCDFVWLPDTYGEKQQPCASNESPGAATSSYHSCGEIAQLVPGSDHAS